MNNKGEKNREKTPTEVKVAIIGGVFTLLVTILTVALPRILDKIEATPAVTSMAAIDLPTSDHQSISIAVNTPSNAVVNTEPGYTSTAMIPTPSVAPRQSNEVDLSGTWKTQFVGITSFDSKEYVDYIFELSQTGKVVSGQARVTDPADPNCTYGFTLRGEISTTNPVTVELSEIGYVAPLSCRFYSAIGEYKDYAFTYTDSSGTESLDGQWNMRFPDEAIYGKSSGMIEFLKQP